jgi:uncharacterized protein (TIGR02996 family)
MTEAEAIFAGILAQPDDDTPRLVFADWLEENGQEDWAEFIRVQIELQSVPRAEPRHKELSRRSRRLLAKQKEVWLHPFQKLLPGCLVKYERGFVSIVKASYSYVFFNADQLWPLAPIREVQVTDGQRHISELCWLDRPPHVRIRADLLASTTHLATVAIDTLPPNPGRLEPFLRTGTWLVLGCARGSGPDIVAMARFADFVLRNGTALGGVNFAVRPYHVIGEFRTWCPATLADRGPHWLKLRDGQLVAYDAGPVDADQIAPAFWSAAKLGPLTSPSGFHPIRNS